MTQPTSPIILALDVPDAETALSWSRRLKPFLGSADERVIVKVGMRLFYKEGASMVQRLHDEGLDVFLDLKLYDIPNTVKQACESLADLGVRLLTLHTSGGSAMMAAAQEGLAHAVTTPVGVTCLTSFNVADLAAVYPGQAISPSAWASDLAALAVDSGVTTLVCSPEEITPFRERFGKTVTLITPGVRPSQVTLAADDQARVMTPEAALAAGADYLVIGRPILQADNPEAVCEQCRLSRIAH